MKGRIEKRETEKSPCSEQEGAGYKSLYLVSLVYGLQVILKAPSSTFYSF